MCHKNILLFKFITLEGKNLKSEIWVHAIIWFRNVLLWTVFKASSLPKAGMRTLRCHSLVLVFLLNHNCHDLHCTPHKTVSINNQLRTQKKTHEASPYIAELLAIDRFLERINHYLEFYGYCCSHQEPIDSSCQLITQKVLFNTSGLQTKWIDMNPRDICMEEKERYAVVAVRWAK